jgi:hypothetical protein
MRRLDYQMHIKILFLSSGVSLFGKLSYFDRLLALQTS